MSQQTPLGEFLKTTLKQRGMTIFSLAEALDVHEQHLYRVCAGVKPASVSLIVEIAEILDLDPIALAEIQTRHRVYEYCASRGGRQKNMAPAKPAP